MKIKIKDTIAPDLTKDGYRLPTWAEWLLAAKGGKPGSYEWDYKYAGSDTASEVGWFRDECGWQQNIKDMNEYSDEYGTKPVATKNANTLGLYDMSGNVAELVYTENEFICAGGGWNGGWRHFADCAVSEWENSISYEKIFYDGEWLDFRNARGFRVVRNAN